MSNTREGRLRPEDYDRIAAIVAAAPPPPPEVVNQLAALLDVFPHTSQKGEQLGRR